ncbi:unnamed protein product [Clonostachys rosea f. rosea IK726]|uniref:Uncharacterized protein n=1 Tax=Clonostachys rosea f. rosea IK726 TaxID=1349383 RepID=A0ACA9UE38_BIOOC|nr:unnamed protein product [Clonostachys rosea f. rosea IK726]
MFEAEGAFDEHIERFSAIIPLCAAYLEATKASPETLETGASKECEHSEKVDSQQKAARKPSEEYHEKLVFTFETGIVPVLFLTAAKCRHPHIRQGAVELLLRYGDRQENLWRAQTLAHIVSRMIYIEAEAGKKFRQEQRQLRAPSLATLRRPCQRQGMPDLPFEVTQKFWGVSDKGTQIQAPPATTLIDLPEAKTRLHWDSYLDCAEHTKPKPYNLVGGLARRDSITPTLLGCSSSFEEESDVSAESATKPITGPSIADFGFKTSWPAKYGGADLATDKSML